MIEKLGIMDERNPQLSRLMGKDFGLICIVMLKLYAQCCEKCQRFGNFIYKNPHELVTISTPWPFYKWGLDILGILHKSPDVEKLFIDATDYFIKWVETILVCNIHEDDVWKFTYNSTITRFSIPHTIVMDNGPQFNGHQLKGNF